MANLHRHFEFYQGRGGGWEIAKETGRNGTIEQERIRIGMDRRKGWEGRKRKERAKVKNKRQANRRLRERGAGGFRESKSDVGNLPLRPPPILNSIGRKQTPNRCAVVFADCSKWRPEIKKKLDFKRGDYYFRRAS